MLLCLLELSRRHLSVSVLYNSFSFFDCPSTCLFDFSNLCASRTCPHVNDVQCFEGCPAKRVVSSGLAPALPWHVTATKVQWTGGGDHGVTLPHSAWRGRDALPRWVGAVYQSFSLFQSTRLLMILGTVSSAKSSAARCAAWPRRTLPGHPTALLTCVFGACGVPGAHPVREETPRPLLSMGCVGGQVLCGSDRRGGIVCRAPPPAVTDDGPPACHRVLGLSASGARG